jgi:hypothetical protein
MAALHGGHRSQPSILGLNPFQGETHCSAAVENVLIMYCFATPV